MSESLYGYYERELVFIRQFAQDFAARYPAAAGRLLLEPTQSGDPHVERLIESFALLAARIHHKLDDEFPELTDALLSVVYPHYLAPIPSMSIVQFELDAARGQLPEGFLINRHSQLRTAPVNGTRCRFRTGYPVTLWPLKLVQASLETPPFPRELSPPRRTAAALRLQFECQPGAKFSDLSLDRLRLFLYGDNHVTSSLYELIFNHTTQVLFRSLDAGSELPSVTLSPEQALHQVGFGLDEGLLEYPPQSFLGYRMLSEFFAFREKFLFVDVDGWRQVCKSGYQKKLELVLFLNQQNNRLAEWIDASTFQMHCTPVVNLFEQTAEPVLLTQRKHEYRVVPDVAQPLGTEVYAVNELVSIDPVTSAVKQFHPFYSFHHASRRRDGQAFWYTDRRPSNLPDDRGTDVYLHLVDLDFQPTLPAESTLVVRTTCTNRDLPAQLQFAGERLYFELDGAAPLSGIRCLKAPTLPLRPPHREGRYWGLMSHLSLNYLSLSDPVQGREALCEILRLYDFSDPNAGQQQLADVTRQMIEGVSAIHTRRVIGRAGGDFAGGFCRGVEVTVEFDEQKYVGTGIFLFASVLERFLGLYAAVNSFTQLVGKTTQSDQPFKRWPRRAGEQALV
ncbi:MAG: type VI secretion system baseplate subunit TssF [Planctomycetia bacterium]|nr:type VI secretion system baseplate subunit TssF [Planctomycetia bacterium]